MYIDIKQISKARFAARSILAIVA